VLAVDDLVPAVGGADDEGLGRAPAASDLGVVRLDRLVGHLAGVVVARADVVPGQRRDHDHARARGRCHRTFDPPTLAAVHSQDVVRVDRGSRDRRGDWQDDFLATPNADASEIVLSSGTAMTSLQG